MNAGNRPQGSVIWITGLSGAGKTTIGRLVHCAFEERGARSLFLDGDELRAVFPNGDRFDRESRLALALSYGRLCRLLALQGFTVICATVSMRHEVYAWNRDNLPGYVEIFLDVDAPTRRQRDPKNHYARLDRGELSDFAGDDQSVDLPSDPHLRIRPKPDEPPIATAGRVMKFLFPDRTQLKARA